MTLLLSAQAAATPSPGIDSHPGDGAGAYKTHLYRNLFVDRLGRSPDETRAKIENAFRQFFHGDGQEERVYFETGANANGPLAYITDWANNDARTEGMSYGMMIAVQLDKKREFDALWNWSKSYMLMTDPKDPSVGYFAWSMNTDGTPRSTGAAPDGEEYYAMALYFAAHRWGNGQGIYNYQEEADKILRGMRHHPVLTGTPPFRIHPDDPPFVVPDKPWPSPNNRAAMAEAAKEGKSWPPRRPDRTPHPVTVGPMVDEAHTMIRFVPETNVPGTDASYHLPAFYELWARWGPEEDRAFWAKAADVSRELFFRVTGPETGLSPDRSHFDMSSMAGWNGERVQFGYDSWRTVSNWSVDYSWWGKDPREQVLSDRVQKFLFGQGLHSFADRYALDGRPLSTRHSPGMVAAAAVGSLSATPGEVSTAFLQELWDMPVPSGEQRYFDGMLYLMSMMHLSGEFHVIEPIGPAAQSERPTPPTRPANGAGAPHWTVVGAPSGSAEPRAATGMNAPFDQNGDFLIGPDYVPAPELKVVDRVPKGTVQQFTMDSQDSHFYPGIARDVFGSVDPNNPGSLIVATRAQPWSRAITVYIPAQYEKGTMAPFVVVHDGPKLGEPDMTLPRVLDNLINQRRVPAMIAVMIQNGGGDAQGSERGLEYDTVSGKFAEFIEHEVLPRVEAQYQVKLTHDPDGRAAMGCSSGAAAAFTMAWFHPEWYTRVISYSGTFVNQQWPFNSANPGGAWDYHEKLIANTRPKPLRVWMQVGDRDLLNPNAMRDGMHDWVAANHRMAAALRDKGYLYQYVFALDAGHCDRKVREQTLPQALEWAWRGYAVAQR